AACIGLAGCAVSDPTRYYTLGPVTAPKAESGAAAPTARDRGVGPVSVGVGPVIMPAYLDRVQIVTRTDADQVDLSMFNRWAEPLQDGMARVLAEEISARVPTERVVTFPWRGSIARIIQYQVVVAVARFDGRPGADVTLDTRWRILGREGDELVFRRSTLTEAAAGPGYEPMVAAMTRAVAALGQEIASEGRALPR